MRKFPRTPKDCQRNTPYKKGSGLKFLLPFHNLLSTLEGLVLMSWSLQTVEHSGSIRRRQARRFHGPRWLWMFDGRNLRWSWSCLLHTCSYYLSAKIQTNLPSDKQIFLIFGYLNPQLSSAANSMQSWFNTNLSFAVIKCPMILSGNTYYYPKLTFVLSPIHIYRETPKPKLGELVVTSDTHYSNDIQPNIVNSR